ncbi:hypothetical protein DICVIV_08162 [Dictyocaulus viviparus]|uniref:Uncharacterized protein n=1 Tax=Dictyocaulus viviparus TaxID=29172 RepID=A0A0D8XTS6_DICVI|nr:hypothetical protein DICVIV_08162 [Dictyocaulus viviparus]
MLQTNTFVVVPEVISFHEVSKTVHRRHSEDLKWEQHEMQNIGNVICVPILIGFQAHLRGLLVRRRLRGLFGIRGSSIPVLQHNRAALTIQVNDWR